MTFARASGPGLFMLVGLLAPRAAAVEETHPDIDLVIDGCEDGEVDAAGIRRSLGVELRARVRDAPGSAPAPARVRLTCLENLVRLDVRTSEQAESLHRQLDVGLEPPKTRSRLVALAVAEAFAPEPAPPAPPPGPATAPAPPPPIVVTEQHPAAISPPAPVRRGVTLSVAPTLRHFSSGVALMGGAYAVAVEGKRTGFVFDLSAERGTAGFGSVGTVDVLAISAAPAIIARRAVGFLDCTAGAGFRVGLVRLDGTTVSSGDPTGFFLAASPTHVFWAPWGGPTVDLQASAHLGRAIRLGLGAELGYAIFDVRGDVGSFAEVRVGGAWLGLGLSLAYALR